MKKTIATIAWDDSRILTESWIETEELEDFKPARCLTTGYVIKETVDYIIVASTITTPAELASGIISIPKSAIVHLNLEETE